MELRYKQKVVLAAILEGKSVPSNIIIFMRSVKFWHQQDSNSLFKGSIGHVTS